MAEAFRLDSQEDFEDYIAKNGINNNGNYNFENVTFAFDLNAEILFAKNEIQNANFKNCVFEKEADFSDKKLKGKTDFSEAVFKDKVFFIASTFECDVLFTRAKFLNEISFMKVEFMGMAVFEETTFSKPAHFWFSKFAKESIFSDAIFEDYAEFSGSLFSNNVHYNRARFLGSVFFSEAVFDKLAFFQLVRFTDVAVFNKAIFNEKLDLRGSVFMVYGLFSGVKIDEADRESYRIIKHELLKSNNRIDALDFYQKEMTCYWESLFENAKWTIIQGNSFIHKVFKYLRALFLTNINEKLMICLNRYSNSYGLSWIQGVKFTVIYVGLPFFLLYNSLLVDPYYEPIFLDLNSFLDVLDDGLQYFVQFLNPTHSHDFMEQFHPKPKGLGYFIDGISRILITYGYYQTIQAFRKLRFN